MIVSVLIIESFEFDNASAYDFIYTFESKALISFYFDKRYMVVDIDG